MKGLEDVSSFWWGFFAALFLLAVIMIIADILSHDKVRDAEQEAADARRSRDSFYTLVDMKIDDRLRHREYEWRDVSRSHAVRMQATDVKLDEVKEVNDARYKNLLCRLCELEKLHECREPERPKHQLERRDCI